MMTKCLDNDFPCQNPDYSDFDTTAKKELVNPPPASDIINESEFCAFVPTDAEFQLGDLTRKDYLKSLNGKVGIYHLWIEFDDCDDHETHTLQCVYVGKGFAELRVNDHIRKWWPDKEHLYVTFYECKNRMSKYYEQLFLDKYNFVLNKNENKGTKSLFAVWDEYRFLHGTELQAVSDRSNIRSIDDL